MPAPVVIDFILRGMPDVARAFRTVEQAAAAASRSQTAAQQRGARERASLAEREARDKVRAMVRADAETKRIQDRAAQEVARRARSRVAAEERAARDVERIRQRSEAAEIKGAERAARQKIASVRQAEAEVDRIRQRAASNAERQRQRQTNQEMRDRRIFARGMADRLSAGVGAGVSRVAAATMQTAGLVAQVGGGFDLASSVQRNAANAGATADLINSGINPFSAMASNRRRRDRKEVEGVLDASTMQYGLSREQGIGGLRAFTSTTGDFETALKILPQLGELSRATGADLDKMTAAAANAGLAFGEMTDSDKKAEKIMTVMRTLAGQGKAGAVEIKDLATEMGKLVAVAGKFEGDNMENIMRMGMMAQTARGGGGAWSAQSASKAISSFADTFGKPARLKEFDKVLGKDFVWSDKTKTKLRAPEQIIAEIFEKTKGDQTKVSKLLGSVMTGRAVSQFGTIYEKGYTSMAGKKLTGKEAVLAYAQDLTKKVSMTKGEIKESSAERMKELDAQMAVTKENFDKAVREKIMPALTDLAPVIADLAKAFVDLNAKAIPTFVDLTKTVAKFLDAHKGMIDSLAAHPIGALIAFEVGKSFASAGLSELLRRLITKMIVGGGAGGFPPPGGGGAGGGKGAAIAAGLAAGAITYAVARPTVDSLLEGQVSGQVKAGEYMARLKNGPSVDKKAAAAEIAKMQEEYGGAGGWLKTAGLGVLAAGGGVYSSLTGDKSESVESFKKAMAAREIIDTEGIKQAITNAVREGAQAGAQGAAPPAGAAASTGIAQRAQ